MVIGLVVLAVIIGLALLPGYWVKRVLAEHSADRSDYPGTGAEFARHLLERLKLTGVTVEEAKQVGDHYDPEAKVVRLSPQHYNGRSLAAVVVAAHEIGHAMQDATGYAPLIARTRLARQAHRIEQIGAVIMLAVPLILILAKSPQLVVLQIVAGVVILAVTILMHAVTLPVEFDASFKRALPALQAGRFIPDGDMPAARRILTAAALTYVASAAMSLLDVMRWFRVLRF